ncbi:transcriptional regulator [Stutzerimonas nosocomialis]|uniref:Rrf2 family transcriptional regulator n=1 Tax=Stutzerimonas nosocomialis TaxID=1056496 RepID=UPI00110845D2|nr:Rrf2 family transcriptional regulator [Stutzerimonas nosocomialis]TLX54340.1 transcriptional regulator [Stutzerimonas nosocomialis]
MRTDSRLSRMLHVLLHMARDERPVTSEQIGQMLGTNAAVVRRTMAGLRKAGYVRADKGYNGGWTLSADLNQVTLLDIFHAVGGPRIFAIGADRDSPDCLVEQVVNGVLADALQEAEALLLRRLGASTLADLSKQFNALYGRCQPAPSGIGSH